MSSLEHHGIKGQKWGVRRFQNPDGTRTSEGRKRDKQERFNKATVDVLAKVSTKVRPIQKEPANIYGVMDRAKCSEGDARTCIKLADEIYARAASEEPRITKDITGIINKTGSSMYGLDHRLKQPTSMAGKIGSDAKSDGVSYEEASKGIKDAVRYTTVSDNESFVSDYRTLKQGLESKGYEEVKCKNFFEKYRAGEVQHKAVQTTFKSPTGYEFELQFQTPESQAAKELKIPIYEERRKQGISSSRAKELEKQMRDLAERVPYPYGIETIESHNKLKHSSIGGSMNYIYGNTLVLGNSSYLEHHGIKGQRWGVRRFQNKDGSRTAEGKKRYKTLKTASAKKAKFETPFGKAKNKAIDKAKEDRLNMVDDIRYGKNKSKYDDAVDEYDKATMHRYDEYEKEFDKYAAIAGMAGARRWWNDQSDDALRDGAEFYMYDDGDQSKYNSYDYFLVGKGENPNEVHGRLYNATNKIMDLAKADAKEALGEYGNTKEANDFALNIFEYATAASPYSMVNESDGLTYSNDEIAEMRRDIDVYTKEAKRLGLIHMDLTVSEGTLYLEHHGIKGQRWGVRRFQNKDGSLTNAGRKRLGYSTKDVKKAVIKGGKAVGGAAVTIGKAGYNLGKKAAAAGKAYSEKKKAEKLEKKKAELEKKKAEAAKTRLGVVKNADLFTVAEMAELNKKFKAKDEMTLASLQKGADYFRLAAGMVGAVSSINKDFESMTGKSLIPNPVKKEKEKREADERAEDRARKLAKEDAEEDRKRRADERKARADDIDFKNKAEDLKNKKSEELRKQAAESRAQAKQTWDEAQAAEKTRAMKGVADENEAKAAIKRQELKTNEIAQREEAVAKREAAVDESEERINYARKEVLKRIDDADTYRDALRKATDMLRNAHDLTREQQDEVWAFIKKAQKDKLGHDGMHDLYLEHHGIKGQRWGVRRFQNPDGTLTDKGRKHYQKKLDREKRKQVSSDAMRGTLERQHGLAVGASGIITGVAGALSVAAVASNPVTIAAGAAIAAAVSAGITHGSYSVAEAWEGRGSRIRKKKIAKYENMLKQDGFIVEDGTLYLEHFGIKNMKWGVRRFQNKDGSLTEAGRKRYGSGNDEELSGGGGGGGAPEEDEEMKKKIEEAAKKAGMTVAEYRKKMGSKLYDLFGGKYKKEAEKQRNRASAFNSEAQKHAREYDKQKAIAASESRKSDKAETSGDFRKHVNNENVARTKAKTSSARKTQAENARLHSVIDANKAQDKYEKSLAGRYDKFKADRERKAKMKRDKMIEDAFRKETPGRTHTLPKTKSATATAKPMRKLTSKELSKIRSEAKKRRK